MNFLDSLLSRRRLVLATTALLAFAGLTSWSTMPREEDPQFPRREGLIITAFPGADALTVERLVTEPLEEALAEVEAIDSIESTARAGVSIQRITLFDTIYDTATAWDEVEDAVEEAKREFPEGVLDPDLDDDLVSQDAIVYAMTGASDPLVLLQAAEELKRELLAVPSVKKVNIMADPGEQVFIEYDDATARRLGLDASRLGAQLSSRSRILPGGSIRLGEKTASLRPQTEFRSLDEIRATPITLPSGSTVPLGELARVRRGPEEPQVERMRWNGEPAIAVGVMPQDGIDRVAFGDAVRARVARVVENSESIHYVEMIFQPDLVKARLNELTTSLQLGILIVAGILFMAMGLRLGLLVAMIVPLVAFSSVAIFAAGGGILHQISIAALVIALGMLVDNAIVVAESIQYRIDQGHPSKKAAIDSIKELAFPLGTATGTTLAAFVPMLISKGNTADFTRTIPVMIMLSLTVSYLFAILVTPVLADLLLRKSRETKKKSRTEGLSKAISRLAVHRSGWVLVGAVLLLGITAYASQWVEMKFFPPSDRQTVVVALELPEGTHLETTDQTARQLERALLDRQDVTTVGTYIGRDAPRFYYNLLSRPNSPHRAMLVVETSSIEALEPTIDWVRDYVGRELPDVSLVAQRLEQGPPLDAPIDLRVVGNDLRDLEKVADELLGELKNIEGTRDVRHDLGLGVPTMRFEIDDAAASRYGISRADVAQALYGRTLGLEVGQYRVGEDSIPILVRSSEGEELPAAALATLDIAGTDGQLVPLAQVASLEVEWLPAAIYRKERSRVVRVQAQLTDDRTVYEALADLQPTLDNMELPSGIELEMGGELEESGKANAAIASQLPLGLMMLLFFLLLEFNSFRRIGIILVTIPLAAVGVVPGLILTKNPFGFMSMLGVISLVGIVVNNAIVLLDVIETRRRSGATIEQALEDAVRRRTRPILLTMATTIAGLLPLAFSKATLWPPLAWAMISGLMASTVLTLLVVPALYRLLFSPRQWNFKFPGSRWKMAAGTAGMLLCVAFVCPDIASATPVNSAETAEGQLERSEGIESLSLEQAMARAMARPAARASAERAAAAEASATAVRRSALWPVLDTTAEVVRRDRDFEFETPIGAFSLGERTSSSFSLQVTQPLFVPSTQLYEAPAAKQRAAAAQYGAERNSQLLAAEAAEAWLTVLSLEGRARTTEAFRNSLRARLDEMQARVEAGRVLESEALKIELELESAELDQIDLHNRLGVATRQLGRAVGAQAAVGADWQGKYDRQEEPNFSAALSRALAARADARALRAELMAAEFRARAIRAEAWPKIEAQASWQLADGAPFRPEELGQAGLVMTWSPFASGTRAPRAAAARSEAKALAHQLEELERAIGLDIRTTLAELTTAREAARVRERGVELATETLRVEREKSHAGRSTTNDLLDAEAALRNQTTLRDLARLNVLRAWVLYDLAVGSWQTNPTVDEQAGE